VSEVAVAAFSPLLDVLSDVPDPRRAQGRLYKLPYVLLFAILAIVTGCDSYRGIVTVIAVHCRRLNAAFGLAWRRAHRAPLHPPRIRSGRGGSGLPPPCRPAAGGARHPRARRHRAGRQDAARQLREGPRPCRGAGAERMRHRHRAGAPLRWPSTCYAVGTFASSAHVDTAEKSGEIPAAQTLLAELGVACGATVTLDALHCQKNISKLPQQPTSR
jgi:DDE_Tnp_1-associated